MVLLQLKSFRFTADETLMTFTTLKSCPILTIFARLAGAPEAGEHFAFIKTNLGKDSNHTSLYMYWSNTVCYLRRPLIAKPHTKYVKVWMYGRLYLTMEITSFAICTHTYIRT